MQRTVEYLNKYGKRVLYVLENPELPVHPKSCEQRPFRSEAVDCTVALNDVMERQADYRRVVNSLSAAVEIIDATELFCSSEGGCTPYSASGVLMYADDDHLSVSGSEELYRFLRDRVVLKQVLYVE